ncbi:MAG TPA: phage terminase small subunit [Sphingobium sp.]|uniref:phage terminase small subunit n=1 Tax=Sphingobium sp. TaxID=1912891 RepID=UPI002ED56DD6
MSLARQHRERILAMKDAVADAPNDGEAHVSAADATSAAETTRMLILDGSPSLARRHVASILAAKGVEVLSTGDSVDLTKASPEERAAAQMSLRLTHDLRRLKEIKGIAAKIEAKRQMLPEYMPWVGGILNADVGVGTGISADIVPTCLVWLIDVGSYMAALDILPFLLRHDVQMPARYNRDPATVAVEEIATAALKVQTAGEVFPIDVLLRVEELTQAIDMHDEPRAKLAKAIGSELLRKVEDAELTAEAGPAIAHALGILKHAYSLNDRVGVRDRIKRAEKLVAAHAAAFPPATDTTNEQGGEGAA